MHWQRDIEVLTPLFNRGAYQDTPEIRVPSIRGMVRWWFRALGGTPDEEKQVFGGMKRFGQRAANDVMASRLVFRIRTLSAVVAHPKNPYTLPHKEAARDRQNIDTERDPRAPRAAFQNGARFGVEVFSRFEPLPPELESKAKRALEVWTLLGSLGLRANRGGGSLWPANAPTRPADMKARLSELGCSWPVYVASTEIGTTWLQLHKAATDTPSEPTWVFGSARPRQSSPLKLKVIRLENQLRLMITAPNERTIEAARDALRNKPHAALCRPDSWIKVSP